MAGLDPNIIMGIKPVQIDSPLDVQNRALTMRGLAQRVQLQDQEIQANQGVRDAYNGNVVTNPDGTKSVNMKGVVQSLYGSNPMKAQEVQTQASQNELTQKQAQMKSYQDTLEALHSRLGQVKDEASYQDLRKWAIENGIPNADKQPLNFDQNWVGNAYKTTASAKDKFEQANLDLRTKEVGAKIDENKIKRQQMQGDKIDKMTKDMKNDLDADKGRAGNFGIISGKVQAAERLDTLINAFKDGNLPPAQQEELALGLSSMLAPGGGQSRAQVEALVPHTAIGDANKMRSWLFNEPTGAGQQAFTKMMADTIGREKSTATQQLNSIRAQRVSAHSRLRQVAPEAFDSQLRSYQMDPKNVDKSGNYITPPAAPGGTGQAPVLKTHEIEWAD